MFISKKAASLTPYAAGEQPRAAGWVKLNTNENPYPTAPLDFEFDRAVLRLYPDPDANRLKDALARLHGVGRECVFVGNGSDEVLAIAFQTLFDWDGEAVLAPDITYSFYPVFASLYDIPYRTVALDADFRVDPTDYDRPCGGIVLANPNAPTGLELSREQVLELVDAHGDVPVVIDEAYADFGRSSVADAVASRKNLLVVRTLSKSYSLAGLRVGYALGDPELIEGMERIKNCFNSYTVDTLAQAIAVNAIERDDVMRRNVERVNATRSRTAEELKRLGFEFPPSSANFIFAAHRERKGKEIFDALKARKILVRRWDAPRIEQHLRISIGTDKEMDALFFALREIL